MDALHDGGRVPHERKLPTRRARRSARGRERARRRQEEPPRPAAWERTRQRALAWRRARRPVGAHQVGRRVHRRPGHPALLVPQRQGRRGTARRCGCAGGTSDQGEGSGASVLLGPCPHGLQAAGPHLGQAHPLALQPPQGAVDHARGLLRLHQSSASRAIAAAGLQGRRGDQEGWQAAP